MPYDYKSKASAGDNWPKLLQLAWSICDQFGNQIKRESFLVKPEGFEISNRSFEIHGISNEIAEIAGISLPKVLNLFINDLQQVKCIVAHNYEFDANVLASEMMRIGLEASVLLKKEKICTMQKTVDYCELKNYYGKKLPSLLELYEKLFGKIVQAKHSAGYDIVLLEMCVLRLLKIKVLEPDYLYKL